MPISIQPIKRVTLKDLMDQLGLTLIIREDESEEWNAYMTVPGVEDEFDLFEEWNVECGSTPRDVAEQVAEALSYEEWELGDHVTIDCKTTLVEVGDNFPD